LLSTSTNLVLSPCTSTQRWLPQWPPTLVALSPLSPNPTSGFPSRRPNSPFRLTPLFYSPLTVGFLVGVQCCCPRVAGLFCVTLFSIISLLTSCALICFRVV
jgi:hypothetical protein